MYDLTKLLPKGRHEKELSEIKGKLNNLQTFVFLICVKERVGNDWRSTVKSVKLIFISRSYLFGLFVGLFYR